MSGVNLDQWLARARMADGQPMTDDRLREVFDLVRTPGGWKEPINARVPKVRATRGEIETAVCWFAGGTPDVRDDGAEWHVTGAGYYEWVGA